MRARASRAAAAALIPFTLVAFALISFALATGPAPKAASATETQAAAAAGLDPDALRAAADRAAAAWPSRQLKNGRFRDYVTGGAPTNYGLTMLGYGLLRSGARTGSRAEIDAAVRALDASTRLPSAERGSFQVLALASAYNFARRGLARDPAFLRSRAGWERALRSYGKPQTGPGAAGCFRDPRCFNNLKLVEAAGNLELLATGLRSNVAGAKLADRAALRRDTLAVVGTLAPDSIGTLASSSGPGPRGGLGILSDPASYPLAYHVVSTAMLARSVELLGTSAPERARATLRRAAETLAAFMGPDGDVAYIGRSQQDAFAPALAAYAGAAAARELPRPAPAAERYAALSSRALERLTSVNGFGPSGFNVAPRLGDRGARDYLGIDHYANTVVYNGLALFGLNLAADAAAAGPTVAGGPLTADGDRHFLDPQRTRFAAVRHGDLWYAVHERQQRGDLRDDFGLVALKQRSADGAWRELLRPRPLTFGPGSAGPVLVQGSHRGLPYGRSIAVGRDGVVTVSGGFREASGRWLRGEVRFRFAPVGGNGVRLSFPARRGDRIELTTFLPAGKAELLSEKAVGDGTSVAEATPRPAAVSLESGFASCCDAKLVGARMTIRGSSDGPVTYTVRGTGSGARGDASSARWIMPASLGLAVIALLAIRWRNQR
jgi:hypothetical protein